MRGVVINFSEILFPHCQWLIQLLLIPGHANYSALVPKHSYIDVRDFSSPEHLAKYLDYLDRNPDEYLKYFWWTTAFVVDKVIMQNNCER